MTLTQDLAQLLAQNLERLPQEAQATMAKAGNEIAQLGIEDNSLKAGDQLPAITLPNAVGKTVSVQDILQSFGVDLTAYNGDATFELPVPATYIATTDGAIAHAFVNVDYTKREDPEQILAVLKQLKTKA